MAVWAAATAFKTSATASRAWPRMRCVAKGSFSASQGQPPSPNNVKRPFSRTRCPEAVAGVATEARTGAYNTSANADRQAATPPSDQSTRNRTRMAPRDSACVWCRRLPRQRLPGDQCPTAICQFLARRI